MSEFIVPLYDMIKNLQYILHGLQFFACRLQFLIKKWENIGFLLHNFEGKNYQFIPCR